MELGSDRFGRPRRSIAGCLGPRTLLDFPWLLMLVTLVVTVMVCRPVLAEEPLPPPSSGDDFSVLREVLSAAEGDDHKRAQKVATRAKSPLPLKIARWLDYRRDDSEASFSDIAAFIKENPDWPSLERIEASAERAMGLGVTYATVLDWFKTRDPVSRDGRIQLIDAALNASMTDRATKLARQGWRDDDFGPDEETEFLTRFGKLLQPADHQARLDRLLWENKATAARRLFPFVDKGWQALAEARLALHAEAKNAPKLLTKVPAELKRDAGLTYERVRWRRLKGNENDARALLVGVKSVSDHADLWWQERRLLARDALEAGASRDAYRLTAAHGLISGSLFAEAEWLAGWIALRHRGDAKTALKHFARLHDGVSAPISLSRAGYWAGRAAEAAGDVTGAKAWYERAAAWPATFYGQLAAARAHAEGAPLLGAVPSEAASSEDTLPGHELLSVARMLALLGEDELVTPFILRLGELARGPADHTLIATVAVDISRPDLAVRAAKLAASRGFVSVNALYPLAKLPLVEADQRLEHPLVLAIARQESQFDPAAKSPAGALGLMQLMPATAQQVAKKVGVKIRKADLTRSPALNVKLGSHYLASLVEGFDGSYVLATAAYNAGPTNVRRWIEANGNLLNDSTVDPIDWIESIPFGETRNYVQRVLEGVQVYRWRLGQPSSGASLERDLVRGITPAAIAARCAAKPKSTARAATLRSVC